LMKLHVDRKIHWQLFYPKISSKNSYQQQLSDFQCGRKFSDKFWSLKLFK
jgi:hypothetical protein